MTYTYWELFYIKLQYTRISQIQVPGTTKKIVFCDVPSKTVLKNHLRMSDDGNFVNNRRCITTIFGFTKIFLESEYSKTIFLKSY